MRSRSALREIPRSTRGAGLAALRRLPSFVGAPPEAAKVLRSKSGLIVGCGAVGRDLALHCSRSGIGRLAIADPKRLALASLETHSVPASAVGHLKALFTARQCKALNPQSTVLAYAGRIEELPLTAIAGADFCVLATDNLAAEVFVGQRCLNLGVPLWQASVHGDTLVAQIRSFRNADGTGPCPRCLYGRAEIEQLDQSVRFSCEGGADPKPRAWLAEQPTMSVSSLCALASSALHLEIFRATLGLGPASRDEVIDFRAYTRRVVVSPLRRNPDCPCDHTLLARRPAPRALGRCTPQELIDAAGFQASSIAVDEFIWAGQGRCHCPEPQPIRRFLAPRTRLGRKCAACGDGLLIDPFHAHATVPLPVLGEAIHRSLEQLGAGSPRWVILRNDTQAALFLSAAAATL